jgi:glycine/D-amino acid oxidase-like deaminating enzyme
VAPPIAESYWLRTAPPFSGAAAGAVEGRVDVAIVGGGFTGLSAALALAKGGASVAVLEAGRVIGEASGRNGGHCSSGLAHDFGALAQSVGLERASAYNRAYCDAVDTVERLVKEESIDCDFRRCGRLKLASKPSHYDKFRRSAELLATVDPNVSLVSPDRIGDEVGSDRFHGGLLQSTSAQLHVGKFGVGLAEAAARRGARIYENAAVTGLQKMPGRRWAVETPRGRLDAGQVLVATGGASKEPPFGWFRRRIVSVGSFVIGTEPLDEARIDRILPKRRNYGTSKNLVNYFRLSPDNRLIFGGRARFALSNPSSDQKSGRVLQEQLVSLFPGLADVGIDYVWGGTVDLTADRLPRAGEHEGLFYSVGYSGHGVQMSVHMGEVMADLIGGKPTANPWDDLEWRSVPGHFGKPWFLPFVGAYYRLKDMIA